MPGLPLPAGVDPVTGLPLGGSGGMAVPGMGGGRPGGLPGMGMAGGAPWNPNQWDPNQVWEVKSYLAIAGKPQPEKGLTVQGHEPFAVDERGNIMFRRRVR